MAACNRDPSPVLKRKEKERHMELVLEEDKIHRIVLKCPALCKIAHVESPNCIWIKLLNNVADDLHVVRPAQLEPLLPREGNKQKPVENGFENHQELTADASITNGIGEGATSMGGQPLTDEPPIRPFLYVLAPLKENVYARGRIVHIKELDVAQRKHTFTYVHFIDEGYGAWMSVKCLAKMDPAMYFYPWQTFPIALFKVHTDRQTKWEMTWPLGMTDALLRAMSSYEYFKVVPVADSRRTQSYYEYIRADIYGLQSLDDDEGKDGKAESLTHRMLMEYGNEIMSPPESDEELEESEQPEQSSSQSKIKKTNGHQPIETLISELNVLDTCFDRALYDSKQQPLEREYHNELSIHQLSQTPRWRLHWPKRFSMEIPAAPAPETEDVPE